MHGRLSRNGEVLGAGLGAQGLGGDAPFPGDCALDSLRSDGRDFLEAAFYGASKLVPERFLGQREGDIPALE